MSKFMYCMIVLYLMIREEKKKWMFCFADLLSIMSHSILACALITYIKPLCITMMLTFLYDLFLTGFPNLKNLGLEATRVSMQERVQFFCLLPFITKWFI